MFTDIGPFESVNSLESLPCGDYEQTTLMYCSSASALTAVLKEFSPAGTTSAIAAELVAILEDGSVLFRDFQLIDGFGWRDSYGSFRQSLGEHMPNEVLDLPVVSAETRIIGLTGLPRTVVEYTDNND